MKFLVIFLILTPLQSFAMDCAKAEKMGDFLNMNGKSFMEASKTHKLTHKTELSVNVGDVNQARKMAYKFPALEDLGFPPVNKNWDPFIVKMDKSSLKGMRSGWQYKNANGDIAIIRLDYDPIKGGHYNIDVMKKTPKGKESYKLAIEFDCNGRPCTSEQVVKLAKGMN
ncbi:MAG: hypothetical protein H0V66_03065 [Bdellovibrionales bacterium]|nr:hypothetical protein [Bdellovibrionales bacterium]